MKKNKLAIALLIATGSLTAGSSFAVEPLPIKAGAFDLVPTVKTDLKHTDNMFLSDTNEVSSNLWIISPRVEAKADNGNSSLTLVGQVDEANYSATSEDDYTDWLASAAGHIGMSGNSSVDLTASYFRTREMRGSGFSQGGFLPTTPDRYEDTNYGASYQLGTNETFGRLVLSAVSYDKSYMNNRFTTQFRDREDMDLNGTLYLNMSDRTAILFQYLDRDVDYVTDPLAVIGSPDSLDSTETYYYAGVSWQATGKTTGTIKVGNGEKEFDDADRLTTDSSSWEAGILWEPLSYSAVNLTASRKYDEATGVGNALLSRRYGLDWQHGWSDTLKSTVNYNRSNDDYIGSTRADTLKAAGVRLDYSVQRWLDLYFLVSRDERESNFGNFNYKQNLTAVGFNASL